MSLKVFDSKDHIAEWLSEEVLNRFIPSKYTSDGDVGFSVENYIHGQLVGNRNLIDLPTYDGGGSELKTFLSDTNGDTIHIARCGHNTFDQHKDYAFNKMKSCFLPMMTSDILYTTNTTFLYPDEPPMPRQELGYRCHEIMWLEDLDYDKFREVVNVRRCENNTKISSTINLWKLKDCYENAMYLTDYSEKKYA